MPAKEKLAGAGRAEGGRVNAPNPLAQATMAVSKGAAALALMILGGCERQILPVDLGRLMPAPPVVVSVPAATTADAAPSATGAIPPINEADNKDAPDEVPPGRTGIAGSTRGTVACGASRCQVPAERCYWHEPTQNWACARPGMLEGGYGRGLACDDASDCRAGMACCGLIAPQVESACVPQNRFHEECMAELCVQGGPLCPVGRTCTASSPIQQGNCVAPKGPATCEGRTKCSANAPICIENAGKLQCVAKDSPAYMAADLKKRWQCTRPDDCHAGDTCSYTYGEFHRSNDLGTYCARRPIGIEGTRVCDPSGPSLCVRGGTCGYECVATTGGPPWMGIWVSKR